MKNVSPALIILGAVIIAIMSFIVGYVEGSRHTLNRIAADCITMDVFRKGDHAFTCFKEIPKNGLQ